MPQESVAPNASWQWDYIDHYRLDDTIIDGFLKKIWGEYMYHVKVSEFSGQSESAVDRPRGLTWISAKVTSTASGCLELWKRLVVGFR